MAPDHSNQEGEFFLLYIGDIYSVLCGLQKVCIYLSTRVERLSRAKSSACHVYTLRTCLFLVFVDRRPLRHTKTRTRPISGHPASCLAIKEFV